MIFHWYIKSAFVFRYFIGKNVSNGTSVFFASCRNGSSLTLQNMNPHMKAVEYAVRGPLVIRATKIEKELENVGSSPKYSFQNVIKANIGDAHAMGNPSITFLRQVLALVTYPSLLQSDEFPSDAKSRAQTILGGCGGGSIGSYSDSSGIEAIKKHVTKFITNRDAGISSNLADIILCAGASDGIRSVLKMFSWTNLANDEGKAPSVLIPIPQYPLYSATLSEFNITQVGYYLDESKNWSLDISELDRAVSNAREYSHPRAIVVINPGNPTGQVLTKENIENVIKFALRENLFILADEVYQDNVYAQESAFHSFKKVMMSMGSPYDKMELASFMSCSKGYMGECGIRGGYTEICNLDPDVKSTLLKCISAKLCPTVFGQACIDVVVNPPIQGEPSFNTFSAQKKSFLDSLAQRAQLVVETLNNIKGFSCNPVQGAMYAFPRIHLPKKALKEASTREVAGDYLYASQLLEATGICIVPGSGFGQQSETYHFRTTILPQKEKISEMLERLKLFHVEFMKKYQD